MATNPPAQQQAAKKPKPEMWFITLAKSKTMRFFAVSCEFIIFLGCLWLTLVTILPNATNWLWGDVDSFFLVALGFAVDAALPEAWLHVVDQYIDQKQAQLKWSIPIAIAMLLLVFANFVYTKLINSAHPTGATEILVSILLISRMGIGICYVTIRECQSFIDRKHAQSFPPALPIVNLEEFTDSILAQVNHSNQVLLEEVNRVKQQGNQDHREWFIEGLQELRYHNQQMIDTAIERLEKSNGRRLEAVWTQLKQVTVSLESNPSLPAVDATNTPLSLPGRGQRVNNQSKPDEGSTGNQVNQSSEPSEVYSESKIHQARAFVVNHYQVNQTLPALALIMAAANCSKGLASRQRKLAAIELGAISSLEDE